MANKPLWLLLLLGAVLLPGEAVLAGNKFEIIGGGVTGSGQAKQAFIETALYVAAGVALLMAVLAVVVPHRNPLFLNYANWRQSAILFVVVGLLLLGGAVLVG
jgi:hypothetical protein